MKRKLLVVLLFACSFIIGCTKHECRVTLVDGPAVGTIDLTGTSWRQEIVKQHSSDGQVEYYIAFSVLEFTNDTECVITTEDEYGPKKMVVNRYNYEYEHPRITFFPFRYSDGMMNGYINGDGLFCRSYDLNIVRYSFQRI